ncbi:aspartate carbamoyltransferase [Candidatus Micrarchaeota archaeon]|nr:aspartate carbamoyltransferase [Candidatus Micrarchaeota archaeon]
MSWVVVKGQDLISIKDLSKEDIEYIFKRTLEMEKLLVKRSKLLDDKIIATLFFESSTRTRMSFQSAALHLGARVIGTDSAEASSMLKGETLSDTIKMVNKYADLIVIRHPSDGSARLAAEVAEKPVINAGDGANQHPSQTILDLYTILKKKGRISKLNVYLVGDLKHARAMRSLLYGLGMFNSNVVLVAPKGLEMEKQVVEEVKDKFSINIEQTNNLNLKECDVLYVCRIQKERFVDPYEAAKVQKEFRITEDDLKNAKDDLIILHPLPKIDEIDPSVDKSKFAAYFEQAGYGVPVRMAIIASILGR